jgi:two-component system chemotaxis sensor kinase CheA
MAIDLSGFAAAFLEEAGEHADTLEQLLVAIDLAAPDAESLNAIFRAAHSIKGGAGAFGYGALAEFTHELESALDRLRKRQRALGRPLVGVLLRCVDAIRDHLARLRHKQPAAGSAFASLGAELTLSLEPPAMPTLRVELALDPQAFPGREAIDALVESLAPLGTLENSVALIEASGITVLGFDLRTASDAADVRESLQFVVAGEAIRVCGERVATFTPAPEEEGYGFFEPAVRAAPAETERAPAALSDADSIRINVAKIDALVNLVGELVITQAMVARNAQQGAGAHLAASVASLERNTRDLQRSILSIRMLPVRHVTSRLPRLALDLSERLGKPVQLDLEGEDTEIDKGVVEKLADPLMHLVRNAIDHGIEDAQSRSALGKPACGRVLVRARHEGGRVAISVADDGAGLDRAAIAARASAAGIDFDADAPDEAIWPLIFRPGLSTASAVTEVSGRGVGMDVVQRNVHALGGTIDIASSPGRGATFTLRLPLTLAIIEGLSIDADGESYIVPLACIAQSMRPADGDMRTLGGREVVRFNGAYVPVLGLGEIFGHAGAQRGSDPVLVVLEVGGRTLALRADRLLGIHNTVVKGLEDNYRRIDGISGATILGDGRVALILDAQRLVDRAGALEPLAA